MWKEVLAHVSHVRNTPITATTGNVEVQKHVDKIMET
jgi:hypothetical protein